MAIRGRGRLSEFFARITCSKLASGAAKKHTVTMQHTIPEILFRNLANLTLPKCIRKRARTCDVYHSIALIFQPIGVDNDHHQNGQNKPKLLYTGTFVDGKHIVDQRVDQKERRSDDVDQHNALLVG